MNQNANELEDRRQAEKESGMIVGMLIFFPVGIALFLTTGNPAFIGVGVAVGIPVGMAIGEYRSSHKAGEE